MKILFISRAYPPVIGGIEKQNYDLFRWLSGNNDISLIANTKGKAMLPFFVPFAFFKALQSISKVEIILLGDGVLSILGYFLRFFISKPVVCIVHGLDITYSHKLYQALWIKFLKKMDLLIAVGNETIRQGVRRGIPAEKFTFIPNGIAVPKLLPKYSRNDLEEFTGRKLPGKVLLTVGRLIKRKGIIWFIDSVMPMLPSDIFYIIAGDGPERKDIHNTINNNSLQDRTICLGTVTDREKEILYSTADLFIQPNIHVSGDIEGFGIVVLEAASYGLPVIASNLEGLKDAIKDGENGILVQEKDALLFRNQIESLLHNDEQRKQLSIQAREYVANHFDSEKIAARYIKIFERLLN
jgi:phosphatidylinositol alpha-1,6-mannosyltransferase